jgi:magnesium-transporting ATPase (P-type)
MDTLGALALATEPPLPELLDRLPYKRTASLISMPMWRNIAVQSIFQLILMCILLFGRESLFPSIRPNEFCNKYENNGGSKSVSNGKSCDDFDEWCPSASEKCWDDDYAGKSDRDDFDADFVSECLVCKDHDYTHGTIMFNAFIFAQLFNEYNARSLLDDIDVWSGALKNPIFMGVSIVTVAMQVMLVEIGGEWLKTSPLTGEWWGITIGLGAISIPFGILMRYIPIKEDPESFARPKPIKVH